jgi:hypothetical protein
MPRTKAPKISKGRQKKRMAISKRKKNDFISDKISVIMKEFDETGMVGRSAPRNRRKAQKQAVAIAYSMADRQTFAATEGELQNDMLTDAVSGFRLMGGIIVATLLIDYALKTNMFKEGLKWDN